MQRKSCFYFLLQELVLEVGTSIPSLQSDGDAPVSDLAGKAALLSNFSDGKQSTDDVDCPVSCHSRSMLCSFAFRSCEVCRQLSMFDLHGGVEPLRFHSMFFIGLASVLDPKFSIMFRRLLGAGLFPTQWCCADVVLLPSPFYCPDLDQFQG